MGNQSRGPTSMGNTPNRRTPPRFFFLDLPIIHFHVC